MSRTVTLLSIIFVIFLGTSCHKESKNKEKSLHITYNDNPATIDPRKSGDVISSCVIFNIFDGLLRCEPNGDIIPSLAKSVEVSKDKKRYTFHLRDAKWSDGTPLTAEDFVYTWKTSFDPNIPCLCAQLLFPIKNAEKIAHKELSFEDLGVFALDDHTLCVDLEYPAPYFKALTCFCNFFPLPKHIVEKNPNWDKHIDSSIVCCGAFKPLSFTPNKELVLEKNPYFWNADQVEVEKLHMHIISDPNTALQLYDRGEIDILGTAPLPKDAISFLLKRDDLHIFPMGGTAFVSFNVNQFPFTNKNIRKAFSYAINRSSITKAITQANEPIGTRCIPPVMVGNKNRVVVEDYKPNLAKEFLNKGLKEMGITLKELGSITLTHVPMMDKAISIAIKDQWEKELGVPIRFDGKDYKSAMDKMYKHTFQAGLCCWIVQINDPMNIFDRFKYKNSPKNYPNWENAEYIRLLDASNLAEDEQTRLKYFEQIEDLFLDEAPISPVFHFNSVMLVQPKVKNFGITPAAYMRFDQVRIEK